MGADKVSAPDRVDT